MKKTWVLLLTVLLTGISLQAQFSYRSYNSIGIVAGNSETSYQVLTNHGVQHKSWYAGIGTGIDGYRIRTFPLYVSVLKDILPKNNMFININAGTQFLWGKNEGNFIWNSLDKKVLPGFLGEAGTGYRLKVGNEGQSIMFGTYFSYKSITESFKVEGVCTNPPCGLQNEYITSQFSRWAFKFGFVF